MELRKPVRDMCLQPGQNASRTVAHVDRLPFSAFVLRMEAAESANAYANVFLAYSSLYVDPFFFFFDKKLLLFIGAYDEMTNSYIFSKKILLLCPKAAFHK